MDVQQKQRVDAVATEKLIHATRVAARMQPWPEGTGMLDNDAGARVYLRQAVREYDSRHDKLIVHDDTLSEVLDVVMALQGKQGALRWVKCSGCNKQGPKLGTAEAARAAARLAGWARSHPRGRGEDFFCPACRC